MVLPIREIIDRTCNWLCIAAGMLIIFLVLSNVYAVIMRYIFNAPVDWSLEVSEIALVCIVFLGTAYTLNVGGHVRITLLTDHFSQKSQYILEIVSYLIVCIFCIILTLKSWELAWLNLYKTSASISRVPLFPGYIVIPIGTFILLLQALSKLIHLREHYNTEVQ